MRVIRRRAVVFLNGDDFPSFSEGLSLREGRGWHVQDTPKNFPSFSEGLSLRDCRLARPAGHVGGFPFLFGGTFIEGQQCMQRVPAPSRPFPFLFGGTFIEGDPVGRSVGRIGREISLPFRRDFH